MLRELNERRLARGPDAKITPDLLDVEQQKIFEDFYLRTLQDFPVGRAKLSSRTNFSRRPAIATVAPSMMRSPARMSPSPFSMNWSTAGSSAYEDRHHTRRVELTHDVLIPVIKASRDTGLTREALAKAERQKLEAHEKERATRRRFAVVVALLLLAIAMALWGWRANIKSTNVLHYTSQAALDFADEVSREGDWTKSLTFLERAARNWPEHPDVAPRVWAQLRHGAASRAPLLVWSHPIPENSKLAWDPEGKLIATVSPTQPLELWEAESGTLFWDSKNPNLKLTGYKGGVHFSSDGERIILRRSKDLWSIISLDQRKLIFESEGETS